MYYTLIDTMVGEIFIAGDDDGLKIINFQNAKTSAPLGTQLKKDPVFLKTAVDQLTAYFAGELKAFDLKLAPVGTAFQRSVWKALMNIPYGETASYKDVAVAVGNPKAVRAVGGANGRNPLPIIIPCTQGHQRQRETRGIFKRVGCKNKVACSRKKTPPPIALRQLPQTVFSSFDFHLTAGIAADKSSYLKIR